MNEKSLHKKVGVVTIGRNEGERLKNCIRSLLPFGYPVVYVDSASTDDSVAFCRGNNIDVVELDMSLPFSAARARNEGFAQLQSLNPELEYVQFIDGDCQLDSEWFEKSIAFMEANADYAAVCGRRREIHPDASIYNTLCDIEWNTTPGDANACGGDVLMRVEAFVQAGKYRPDLIAGEEPELCFRMRQNGWKVHRIDAEMTLHDANMMHFSQWWKRAKRAGYAYTNGAWLHWNSPERYNVRPVLRIVFWALVLPLLILMACTQSCYWALLLLAYPLHYVRMLKNGPSSPEVNRKWAKFIIIGKFAELSGVVQCVADIVLGRKSAIIEYK